MIYDVTTHLSHKGRQIPVAGSPSCRYSEAGYAQNIKQAKITIYVGRGTD